VVFTDFMNCLRAVSVGPVASLMIDGVDTSFASSVWPTFGKYVQTDRQTDRHNNVTGLQSKSLSVPHHTLRHPTTEALKIPLLRIQNAKTSYTENTVSDITQ